MGYNDAGGGGGNSAAPGQTEVYTTSFDWDSEPSAGMAIVEAIEEFRGDGLDPLDPLQYTVDVDALDQLFEPRSNGRPRLGGRVSFTVDELRVTLHADGFITVNYAEQAG